MDHLAHVKKALNHPILIFLEKYTDEGIPIRRVAITPPWNWDVYKKDTSLACEDFDDLFVTDRPSSKNRPGIRLVISLHEDYYYGATSEESRLLAWEIQAASEIADKWETFWVNPDGFISMLPNPEGYRWKVVEMSQN